MIESSLAYSLIHYIRFSMESVVLYMYKIKAITQDPSEVLTVTNDPIFYTKYHLVFINRLIY